MGKSNKPIKIISHYNHKYKAMAYAIKNKSIRENMLKICQDESKSDAEVMESIVKTAKWIGVDDVSMFFEGDVNQEVNQND